MAETIAERKAAEYHRGPISVYRSSPAQALSKRAIDLVIAGLATFVLLPLLLFIGIAIRLDSNGPILFLQQRSGMNRKPFVIFKFRTMTHAAERQVQATVEDPRVTKVGRFLRRSSLDELPQIINVLKGDMSIVGPRPHPLWLDEHFACKIESYWDRYLVRPGITGLAQINHCRGETATVDDMIKRVKYDTNYVTMASLKMDIKIIALTIYQLIFARNAY
jgi:putative colanic acid biosynthesis UDP-glucose lipid carrier transferase